MLTRDKVCQDEKSFFTLPPKSLFDIQHEKEVLVWECFKVVWSIDILLKCLEAIVFKV